MEEEGGEGGEGSCGGGGVVGEDYLVSSSSPSSLSSSPSSPSSCVGSATPTGKLGVFGGSWGLRIDGLRVGWGPYLCLGLRVGVSWGLPVLEVRLGVGGDEEG